MNYLISAFVIFISFSAFGLKTNTSLEKWAPPKFQFSDTVFYLWQTKEIDVFFRVDHGQMLTESAKLYLDTVAVFMNKNNNLSFEISNHTDSRGNENFNISLSRTKAKTIYNYLLKKGIDTMRLNYRGAGEEELIYSDEYILKNSKTVQEKELLHQKNRRTVLTITSVSYEKK